MLPQPRHELGFISNKSQDHRGSRLRDPRPLLSPKAAMVVAMKTDTLLHALAGGLEGWAIAFWGGREEAHRALVHEPDKRRHVWLCIWAQMSMRADRLDEPADFALWRERFLSETSASLLRLAGFGEARGLLGSLGKLPWTGLEDAAQYLKLADLLEEGGLGAQTIRHRKRIAASTIETLHALPADLRHAGLAKSLKVGERPGSPQHRVRRWVWRLERLRAVAPQLDGAIRKKLLGGGDITALWAGLPLPPAPWGGTEELRPLDSPAAMRSAAKRFQNCLASQLDFVRRGYSYFYELEGRAVIEFEQVPGLGWEVEDVNGLRNKRPPAPILHEIEQLLSRAPAHISPHLPSRTYWNV